MDFRSWIAIRPPITATATDDDAPPLHDGRPSTCNDAVGHSLAGLAVGLRGCGHRLTRPPQLCRGPRMPVHCNPPGRAPAETWISEAGLRSEPQSPPVPLTTMRHRFMTVAQVRAVHLGELDRKFRPTGWGVVTGKLAGVLVADFDGEIALTTDLMGCDDDFASKQSQ